MKKVCLWCDGTGGTEEEKCLTCDGVGEIEETNDEISQAEKDREFDEGFHCKKKKFEEGNENKL